MNQRRHCTTIGLPVYNGAQYLPATIESILAQTFRDFELIICDNASQDRTESICREYAERDDRIRYVRNERNLGAIPNYNRTFELSSGEYFKWAPADDLLSPDYLEQCVTTLAAQPDAVLCQSLITGIDGTGVKLGVYDSRLAGSSSVEPSVRFAALVLLPHPCTEIVGVIRSAALARSSLLLNFHGGDRALLAELALLGRFVKVREPLMFLREHEARYTVAATRPRDRLAWHDTRRGSAPRFPTWRLYRRYLWLVKHRLKERKQRDRCYRSLLKWWFVNWNSARVAVDALSVVSPDIVGQAQRFKQRVFAPRSGAFSQEERGAKAGHHGATDRQASPTAQNRHDRCLSVPVPPRYTGSYPPPR